ncbi:hypothetical protein NPIL_551561 [Nephila pilipes]|uniref:Uncharacterized protein n=1 Tax=Nephila pilipes TaxID=299642 RepID=A0A8X6M9V0_NEPPI|nr:hypothetical protein NPIL_551561 [Nephila pilipes]
MYFLVLLVVFQLSFVSFKVVGLPDVPNIDPDGNAFVSAFTQEVKSSSVLSELFDMKGNSGEGLGQYIYNDARKNLQSFGVEDAENAAAYATQHLSQDFPVLTFDTLVKVFGTIMARYLSSEGILNEGNSQTLAMEYAKSFEDSANSNMNSQVGSKFIAIGQGFVPFVTSIVQMTPEKGNKIATYFGDAWKLEAASRSA